MKWKEAFRKLKKSLKEHQEKPELLTKNKDLIYSFKVLD